MATLNDFFPTDDVHDVLDDWIRDLMGSSLRSELKNVETLSANKTLTDADTPLQRLNCNGANRIVKMPTGDAVNNHPFFIVNSTSSGTYTLTVQNNAGTVTLITLNPDEFAFLIPDGNGAYKLLNPNILDFPTSTELTISSGSVTPNKSWHTIDTESDASTDDLDTLATTNVTDGFILFFRANNTARTVVVKHNTGNIHTTTGADITLDETYKLCIGVYDANLSKWIVGALGGGGGGGGIQLSSSSPRVYTANNTWSKPADLVYVIVELRAGGGAGGGAVATTGADYSAGGGGGEGGYSKAKILAASLGSTETVTVGAGGTGVSGAGGNTGGTSSFGSHLQATGGSGGAASSASSVIAFINPGAAGVGSGGNINESGNPGQAGVRSQFPHGGGGGGAGGVGQTTAGAFNGNAGNAYGGGGSGAANAASQSARAGAAGAAGVVIVWEYVES